MPTRRDRAADRSPEPVGLRGNPAETLEAATAALRGLDLARSVVIMLTDWQGDRAGARYMALIADPTRAVVTEDAFGPRYGPAGAEALRSLVRGLLERGAVNFKERVVAPHEFSRQLEDLGPDGYREVLAAANPTDPQIYLQ